ncbi:MAG TPA: NUDIX domain-containing protein [Candidatus Saccharimonadales bacterium]|nr:NUDIX domain-containing protein [Candidatus Saccharimonadales bacterium]
MPHIHTKPGEHDATASALIIRFDTPEPRLLLHLHKKHGRFMQPGGHVELHETPWQAVLHEIVEETGYKLSQLELLQPPQRLKSLSKVILHPVPMGENTHKIGEDHYHTDRMYVFAAEAAPLGTPGIGEATEFKWVTAEELQQMPDSTLGSAIREIGLYGLNVCATEWIRVPLSDFQA